MYRERDSERGTKDIKREREREREREDGCLCADVLEGDMSEN